MKKCDKCGNVTQNDAALFCSRCGSKFRIAPAAQSQTPAAHPQTPPPPATQAAGQTPQNAAQGTPAAGAQVSRQPETSRHDGGIVLGGAPHNEANNAASPRTAPVPPQPTPATQTPGTATPQTVTPSVSPTPAPVPPPPPPAPQTVTPTAQTPQQEAAQVTGTAAAQASEGVQVNAGAQSEAATDWTAPVGGSVVEEPNAHLVLAILSTVLCCPPTGIYAIICATKVSSSHSRGRYAEALRYSRKAKNWSVISIVLALIIYVMAFVVGVLSGAGVIPDVASALGSNSSTNTVLYDDNDSYSDDDSVYSADDDESSPSYLLRETISSMQNGLPIDAGSGMQITEVYLSGDYITYTVMCDESVLSIDLLNQSHSLLKNSVKSSLLSQTDEATQSLIDLCKQAGVGIKYVYTGSTSGKKCTVSIDADEL